jgi:hypothetical protein
MNNNPTPRLNTAAGRSYATDSLRLHLGPDNLKQIDAVATRIAAMTGKRHSKPIVLRAGIAALEAQAIAAAHEQSRSKDGTPGRQVTRLLWWLAAAARSVGV